MASSSPPPPLHDMQQSIFVPQAYPITPVTRRLLAFTFISTLVGQQYLAHGPNFLEPFVKQFANDSAITENELAWLWSITNSASTVSQALGFIALPFLMERIGRRFTGMFIANALMLLAILLQCLSPLVNYYELYILGQFVQGFGSAFAPALIMFMAESVPDRFRGGWAHALGGGKCVGVTAMFVGAGSYMVITFAAIMCVGDIFGNEHRWPYFPLAAIPLALPQMLTFRYFPASPKFLYLVRKSRTRALEAIRFYHGKKADAERVLAGYDRESELSMSTATHTTTIGDIARTRHLRIPFALCFAASMANAVSGNQIKGAYLNEMFLSFGVPQEKSMIPIAFVYFSAGCVGVFVALALAERVGRRPLLLFAVGATCLGLLCFALADVYAPGQLSSLMGFLAALILTQSLVIGLDRLPLLLIAELMPQGARSLTVGICFMVAQMVQLAESLLYPPTHPYLWAYSWLMLLVAELACFAVLFFFLPETRNRHVEDIVAGWVDPLKVQLAEQAPIVVPASATMEENGAPPDEYSGERTGLLSEDENYVRSYGGIID